MDPRFDEIFNKPENQIFQIVFFPDRIYHAQYLNATESQRYRYNVTEVRNKLDIGIIKGEVYLDGSLFTNFVRVEYRASRLIELVREKGRWLQEHLSAYLKLATGGGAVAETQVKLHYCPWIRAYQVEIWGTLEAPPSMSHDKKVLALMGANGQITRRRNFTAILQDIDAIATVTTAIREDDIDEPLGYKINDPAWDNNNQRTIQVPNTQDPSAAQNTVALNNYELDFRRGWYLDARKTDPVRYRNGMVDYTNPNNPDKSDNNIIEMRWLLQQELGTALVYFHEVTIPPGCIEGTHRHIGSEELYFIYEGEGVAHMGEGDDPVVSTGSAFPLKQVDVYGLGKLPIREVPVKPGTIIYTKSGGIHGIRNPGATPLRFVAFGYHTV
ncbi:MAG TPA: cupin domain-containing protein [Candidatus Limnocylindria bacterium]|jgi:mannose-6-phosphate isomerase-like protein (cupin superfamily)|nr:cupin domain-containing protein [Candidatus Limnocylindria bacterium]